MKPSGFDPITMELPAGVDLETPADAAEHLWQLWRQGQRPDLAVFLATTGPLSPAQLAAVLRVDQWQRWQTGERIQAEHYLRRFPGLRADAEAAVDVIFNEFLVRERLGERPDPDEHFRRFPEHAAVLRPQIELHRAIRGGPSALSAAPAPDQRTTPYLGGGPAADGIAPRIPVALVPATGPQPTNEVQVVLRKRLLFLAALAWAVLAAYALAFLPRFLDPVTGSAYGLMLGITGALVILLARRRPLSLRALRGMELVLFGSVTVFLTWEEYQFFSYRGLHQLLPHGWVGMVIAGRFLSLSWFSAIVAYGVLIPNTWRRCAAVIGAMALLPLVIRAAGELSDPVPAGLFAVVLIESGISMALAASIAVHGAHRIEVLRQQAAEARKLGQYRLKQRLGAGGMGEVYLAEHALLRRPCALKLIRPERAGDPQHLRRFEREVQATAALNHPSTVEIYDYGHAADGTFYYVMEYLPGLNLDELVGRHGPLPPEWAVHLLRQVCGALAEAHAAGLVHRDIKPGNILVCERGGRHGVAKLLDFGLVQTHNLTDGGAEAARLTQTGTIAGTPAYMSPEQAAGKADLDARADLYSLGAVAYFLLTGRPPFVRDTALLTLVAHVTDSVPPPRDLRPDLPADLEAMVLRCLEKDPGRRFPDAEALERALAGCACVRGWSGQEAADWWWARAAGRQPVPGTATAPGGTPS
jgi:serine/threonine-protein kinase